MRALSPATVLALLLALSPLPAAAAVTVPGAPACPVFPASNVWNRRVDRLPVRADSARLIRSIGLGANLHPDFSEIRNGAYGIPWQLVDAGTPRHDVDFVEYGDESDPGPYPIPADPLVEGGNDRHLITIDRDTCRLYELYHAEAVAGGWEAGSGATWDLGSNVLRPRGWTSADAAGLPIFPGLVRYEEVAAGEIRHALRFTAPETRRAFLYPARHFASASADRALPPMGLRVRLKRSVDISGYPPQARIVLRALKRYGMILADNGSPWYVTGAPHAGWDDDDLHQLHGITGADFEAVDTSGLRNGG